MIRNSERSGAAPDQTGKLTKPQKEDPTRSGTSEDASSDTSAQIGKRMHIREVDGRLEVVEEEN